MLFLRRNGNLLESDLDWELISSPRTLPKGGNPHTLVGGAHDTVNKPLNVTLKQKQSSTAASPKENLVTSAPIKGPLSLKLRSCCVSFVKVPTLSKPPCPPDGQALIPLPTSVLCAAHTQASGLSVQSWLPSWGGFPGLFAASAARPAVHHLTHHPRTWPCFLLRPAHCRH